MTPMKHMKVLFLKTLTFQKDCVICFTESPLKMVNAFCFLLKMFTFLSCFFDHVEKTA